ncbi:helix-turn-helix domain-containing protein [Apibacter sp. B2912]|uniref:helix-turn-helix domain-containing protein n=1 Tax=Apibacter sp. B2912 TaxID=2656763 RepID=UPI00136BCE6E|nr:helix-turn-helix transcriptional regulator [Apibacter sp. B2912]MXO31785.1 helix-turn-helix domain-containing protein [Apibacter sp. B2912]
MYRIDEILKERGITKTKLAEMIGISKGTLSNNLKEPSIQTLKIISEKLNIPLLDLFIDERKTNELTALIDYKGEFFKANTVNELEKIIDIIKEKDY